MTDWTGSAGADGGASPPAAARAVPARPATEMRRMMMAEERSSLKMHLGSKGKNPARFEYCETYATESPPPCQGRKSPRPASPSGTTAAVLADQANLDPAPGGCLPRLSTRCLVRGCPDPTETATEDHRRPASSRHPQFGRI